MHSEHTTNYCDTFIEVATDCPIQDSEIPLEKNGKKTVASAQYEMISANPYKYTSDDIIFSIYAERNNLAQKDLDIARKNFFSKGQACLRSSPLTKRYGFGIHSNAHGKVALYAIESQQYLDYSLDNSLKHLKAMRSTKMK